MQDRINRWTGRRSGIFSAGRGRAAALAVAVAAGVLGTGPALAGTVTLATGEQACLTLTTKQVRALFDRWNTSLATGDPDRVADHYYGDAVLLPTISAKPRTTRDEIKDYFVHFLALKPSGKIIKRTIKTDCNFAIDTGIYAFDVADDKGGRKTVQARYTFTYLPHPDRDGKTVWQISTHHSSQLPAEAH